MLENVDEDGNIFVSFYIKKNLWLEFMDFYCKGVRPNTVFNKMIEKAVKDKKPAVGAADPV